MNAKIISGIGAGIAIIAILTVTLAGQNVQMGDENVITTKMDDDCVLEFKEAFPNENIIKDLCYDSKPNNELKIFPDNYVINSHGFRGLEFSSDKPIDSYRIVLVGGSTMIGSGNLSHETTIAGILQKIIDKQEPEIQIDVINAGIGGSNTTTESKLINERIVDLQPDLIVMYDGWNDLRAQFSPETAYKNWKSVCENGNQNKFDVIIALQPIAGFGNKDLTHQEYVNSLTGEDHQGYQLLLKKDQYQEYADKLKELSTVCTTTIDLRDAFDQVNGSVFWDQGHTAETGNMIIAEKLYEISIPIIQDPNLKNHNIFNRILEKYNNPIVISYLLEQYGIDNINFNNLIEPTNVAAGGYFELKEKFGVNNILVGKDLSNVDLSTISLVDQNLIGANLSGQDLRNIDLTGTILRNVDFTNANLSGLDLRDRELHGAIFNETELYETKFEFMSCKYCNISNTDFSNSIISLSSFAYSTIVNSDFSNLRMIATIFIYTNISNTDFSNSDLSFSKQIEHLPYQKQIELKKFGMNSAEVEELTWYEARDIFNKILYENRGSVPIYYMTNWLVEDEIVYVNYIVINNFADANLHDVNFSNSDLTGVSFAGSTVSELYLDNANLRCMNQDFCLGLFAP